MDELLSVTVEIVASHVAHNSVAAADLPGLIQAVHGSLQTIANGIRVPVEENSAPKLVPAVPIRKSVHHEYIVSLETGQRFQTLVRHLSGLGMSPEAYRAKWGLPNDYPMTAKGYSERRSALAKSLGLGRKPAELVEVDVKKRRPRSKTKATDKAATPTMPPEGIQEATDASLATVEAEAHTTAAESIQQPASAIQEAA